MVQNKNPKITKSTGQSIIEMVVGVLVLVPIVLFLLDVAVVVLANTANDNLAKSAARAAASATDSNNLGNAQKGLDAACNIAKNFQTSSIISLPPGGLQGTFVTGYDYQGGGGNISTQGQDTGTVASGQVAVVTTMTVRPPVPFVAMPSSVDFKARAVEPIVSIAP